MTTMATATAAIAVVQQAGVSVQIVATDPVAEEAQGEDLAAAEVAVEVIPAAAEAEVEVIAAAEVEVDMEEKALAGVAAHAAEPLSIRVSTQANAAAD